MVEAADRLAEAAETRTPCPPVRDLIGRDDLHAAYAVQRRNAEARVAAGARSWAARSGSPPRRCSSSSASTSPTSASCSTTWPTPTAATIPLDASCSPASRPRSRSCSAPTSPTAPLDAAQVRAAVDYAVAALEIVDSRIAGWDITFVDTVADNASSGVFVLGADRRTLDEVDPRDVEMTMTVDGEEVSTGAGAACLGDPLNALAWLARTARDSANRCAPARSCSPAPSARWSRRARRTRSARTSPASGRSP